MIKKFILKKYQEVIKRYDYEIGIKYFNVNDFDGLQVEKFNFMSEEVKLSGYLYNYNQYDPKKLVIFCHGIGPGHLAYMQEINLIASQGYLVLAFDVTGTGTSDGKNIHSMSQSLVDLDNLLRYISTVKKLKNLELTIIGHSWGGYAAGNITNYHKNIKNVIVISGFVSIKQFLKQNLKGIGALFRKPIYEFEKEMNPNYVASSSLDAIKNSETNYLIIHSKDDPMVKINYSAKYIYKKLKNSKVSYLFVDHKKHNPNYTVLAVEYMNHIFNTYYAGLKKGLYDTDEKKNKYFEKVDWNKMTEQDLTIWEQIFNFIK